MKNIILYTDGACSGNPGPGGWASILRYGDNIKELSGGEKDTTNNRMELTGVIEGLKALREPCAVELYSDSQYIVNALNNGWLRDWKKRGWKRRDGACGSDGNAENGGNRDRSRAADYRSARSRKRRAARL